MLHTQIRDVSLRGSLGESTGKRRVALTLKVGGRRSSWLRPRGGEDRAGFSGRHPLSFHSPHYLSLAFCICFCLCRWLPLSSPLPCFSVSKTISHVCPSRILRCSEYPEYPGQPHPAHGPWLQPSQAFPRWAPGTGEEWPEETHFHSLLQGSRPSEAGMNG